MTERQGKRAEALRLRAEGLTIRQIAAELGLPPTTIQNWLPTTEELSKADVMMRLRLKGLNNQQIADRVGLTRKGVAKALGPVPRRKTSGQRKPLDLAPETWTGVRDTAASLGLRAVQGSADGVGSVGMLLDAIAAGELDVAWRPGYGPHQPLGVKA